MRSAECRLITNTDACRMREENSKGNLKARCNEQKGNKEIKNKKSKKEKIETEEKKDQTKRRVKMSAHWEHISKHRQKAQQLINAL